MLPSVCSVIDHRRRQNVVRTSVTHSAIASCATFLFLPHFDVICDLLLNRPTATWNLFVNYNLRLQKRAARVILSADTKANSVDLVRELNWLPFFHEAKINKCALVYKRLNGMSQIYVRITQTKHRHTFK